MSQLNYYFDTNLSVPMIRQRHKNDYAKTRIKANAKNIFLPKDNKSKSKRQPDLKIGIPGTEQLNVTALILMRKINN